MGYLNSLVMAHNLCHQDLDNVPTLFLLTAVIIYVIFS